MGLILDTIRRLIQEQIDAYGIVVWFDPEAVYESLVPALGLTDTTVASYKGSFYALRYEVEPLLGAMDPPRLLVYIPRDPHETDDALAELQAAGVTVQPGQQPAARNTSLPQVVRQAAVDTASWTEADAQRLAREIEEGKYGSLDEIEQVLQRHVRTAGVLELVYGSSDPIEIGLAFLADPGRDGQLGERNALPALTALLASVFGVTFSGETPSACRSEFGSYVLLSDMLSQVTQVQQALDERSQAADPAQQQACVAVATAWRSRRDLQDSYVASAEATAQALGLSAMSWSIAQIETTETFAQHERALQVLVASALANPNVTLDELERLSSLARVRQATFWAETEPTIQAGWALVEVAGRVLAEASHIASALSSSASAAELVKRYSERERPWCLLDTYHRQMERRYHQLDIALDQVEIDRLVTRARQRYMEVGARVSEAFVRAYARDRFRIPGVLLQRQVFEQSVRGRLGKTKTAYVLVDALRYEMAQELSHTLARECEVTLQPAIAMAPTITEVGMAALLPGAHESAAVVDAGGGKLALEIGDTRLGTRKERIAYLAAKAGVETCEAKVEELLPRPKRALEERLRKANLIVVTSQGIDLLSEGDNVSLARRLMDEALESLRRALRVLTGLGVQAFVMASDHGYLFGEELGSDMKVSPPGGYTADLHRRVWVGRGGEANPALLRAQLSEFGVSGDLELATPWNWACFAVPGGASAYFHGGLSPQELIVPVMTIAPRTMVEATAVKGAIAWKLIPGSQKITSPFLSVQVTGRAEQLFGVQPPRVRLELRSGRRCVALAVSASYGFEDATREVQLALDSAQQGVIEPNTVTLQITDTSPRTVDMLLLDAATGHELGRLADIELAISIK